MGVSRSFRTHVGFLGRRNVGKSSVLNALTRQDVAIVSPTPGTTTDPVEKPMELLPLGPVLFVDTAGVDWMELGRFPSLRVADAMRARLAAEFEWGTTPLRLLRRSDGFALMALPAGADDWGRLAGDPDVSEHANGANDVAR